MSRDADFESGGEMGCDELCRTGGLDIGPPGPERFQHGVFNPKFFICGATILGDILIHIAWKIAREDNDSQHLSTVERLPRDAIEGNPVFVVPRRIGRVCW
jgi:hypothetical protein